MATPKKKDPVLENFLNFVPGARFLANTGSVLSGQMPSKEDFQNGALGLVGGAGAVRGAVGAAKMAPYAIESVMKSLAPKTYINNAAKTAYTANPGVGWGSNTVRNAAEDAAFRVAQNKARVVKAVPGKALLGIIGGNDNAIKNMFQTGTRGLGASGPELRTAAEQAIFDADKVQALNYGYVASTKDIPRVPLAPRHSNNDFLALANKETPRAYGETALVFKKGVNNDATVTWGDSGAMGSSMRANRVQGSPVTPIPFNQMGSNMDAAGRAWLQGNPGGYHAIPYVEAQWTKPLTLGDVSKIIAPASSKADIQAALKAAGLRKKVVTWEDLSKPGILDKVKVSLAKMKAIADAKAATKSRERRTPIDDFGKLISPEG